MKREQMRKLTHLLIPKQYRVWCRPNDVPGNFNITAYPSLADCANCLTAFRTATNGRKTPFRVAHTNRLSNREARTMKRQLWDYGRHGSNL